jgi:heat shock protein HtpX
MSSEFGQSVLVYDRIAQNRRKTVILVAFAILSILPFIAGVSYAAAEMFAPARRAASKTAYRPHIMTAVAVGSIGLLGVLFWSVASSPVSKMLSLSGARPASAQEQEVQRLLENLSIGAGLPVPKLYVIDSVAPNAFAAGMDPGHSIVAVTVGLLKLLDHRELEGVLAHEISHIGNRDTRLNTIVASIALFLRLPHLLRKRHAGEKRQSQSGAMPFRGFRYYKLALVPVYIYIFLVAPILAALIRAAISRGREYLADADAALLTRYPEGLLRALAKIGGCGSAIPGSNPVISHLYFADPAAGFQGLFSGSMLATHPPVSARIERLAEFGGGGATVAVIEQAVRDGQAYSRYHPPVATTGIPDAVTQDELSFLTIGNPMGRAYRLLGNQPAKVYDQPKDSSSVRERIPPGDLLVAFDDPGPFRQVNTARQTFGYISRSFQLEPVDILAAEVYDPETRHKALASLPALPAAVPVQSSRLDARQICIAAGFGVLVFAAIFAALLKFG